MASNAPVAAASPLSFMTKLSPCVYLYRPGPESATTTGSASSLAEPAPKLILLASWMGARDPHIAKYIAQYQVLYPSSPILLVRSEVRHFLRPSSRHAEQGPAVSIIRATFPDSPSPAAAAAAAAAPDKEVAPQLLVHAFSNGGCAALQHLRAVLGAFPPYASIFDSCPGQFAYRATHRAFTTGLAPGPSRLLISALMHALCAWYWFWIVLVGRGRAGPLARVARELNERGGGGDDNLNGNNRWGWGWGAEARRTYVYSEADRLVSWRDVERHADEAEKKGFAVRRERFDGSEHVAHMRSDPDRYWRAVRETWEGVEE